MNSHDINLVESLSTIWTLSHTIFHAIFDTLQAEHVAASFERSVLEPILADSAQSKLLAYVRFVKKLRKEFNLP
jgi:hypothetical protein